MAATLGFWLGTRFPGSTIISTSAGHLHHQAPAVSAARPHLHDVPDVNAAWNLHQAQHPPLDVFCPDEEYKESFYQRNNGIPQVDGFAEISSIKCEHCSKAFETLEQLQDHEEMNQFGCDECFHCYTSKFYADLHELEQHPDTFY